MEDIEIQVWDEEKKTRWRELLPAWYSFWVNEPLNTGAIGDIEEGDTKKALDGLMFDQMLYDDSPVIVGFDTKSHKVAGFVFSIADYAEEAEGHEQTESKAVYDFKKYPFGEQKVVKMEAIGTFLEHIAREANVFQKYRVDKVWTIQVISVCLEYTRRGLANKMTAKVLEIAKERGFTLVMCESTSQFIRRMKINRFQFEKVLEVPIGGNYANYSDMPDEMKKSHVTAAVLVKRI